MPRRGDAWMIDRHLNKIIDFTFILSPFGKPYIAGLHLIGARLSALVDCDYVFSLLEWSVRRYVNHGLTLGREELAKGNLVGTLVRAIQPVFDYSLDHASHFVFYLAVPRTWT